MFNPADMAERHGRILAELAELGLGFARDASRDAAQAETPEERARAALVFQRVSRSVRQCLALEAKLAREAGREAREAADRQARQHRWQVFYRKQSLKAGVQALTWRETEDLDEADEDAFDELIDRAIEDEVGSDGFLTDDTADQVARILVRMGLEAGPDGVVRRTGPPAAGAWPGADPAWRDTG